MLGYYVSTLYSLSSTFIILKTQVDKIFIVEFSKTIYISNVWLYRLYALNDWTNFHAVLTYDFVGGLVMMFGFLAKVDIFLNP